MTRPARRGRPLHGRCQAASLAHAARPRRGAILLLPGAILLALAACVSEAGGPHPEAPATQVQAAEGPFDVVFLGGHVLDGSGNPWFRADVGVRDGRIAAIGELAAARADRVVDVTGHVVAPGFIDIHSHADGRLSGEDPRGRAAPSLVAQGVTTLVMNQDGRSPWPLSEQVDILRERGHGPNAILLVGHGEVRRRAMEGDVERPATPEEVERLEALVRQGMAEGAWGISTALEYNPGRWSTLDEVAAAVGAVRAGGGIHVSHMRSEGPDPMWYWPSQDGPNPPTLLDAVDEVIEVAERTGVPSVASHVKAKGAHYWGASAEVIARIQAARDRGVPIYADQYPYETTGSDGNTVLLPGWAFQAGRTLVEEAGQVRDAGAPAGSAAGAGDAENAAGSAAETGDAEVGGDAAAGDGRGGAAGTGGAAARPTLAQAIAAVLADPALAADLRTDVAHEIRRRGGPDRVVVLEHARDPSLDGLSLAEVAARWGTTPLEAAFRLQLEGDPDRRGGARLRGFSLHDDDIAAYAPQDWMLTASDGGIALPEDGFVHVRFYGTFPRKIAHYARDRGILSVPHAVRSATSLPAQVLGLRDRGLVREGFHADLVVFHLDELEDRATFFDPHQFPAGIPWVMVGGTFVVEGGELTGALPGRVLTPADDRTLPRVR